MFRQRNRTFIAICLLLIGTCSCVFAIDMSQAFSQAAEQSAGIDTLFKGKSAVSNLYSKALKLAKNNEFVATNTAFDQLKSYYSDCPRVENQDFINILYVSNFGFRTTFDQIVPAGTKKPTNRAIDLSYAKFHACKKIIAPTADDNQALTDKINELYYDIYVNSFSLSTVKQDNFGSDLFRNGTLDDSDFDLLYDINQIGKILFDDFKESPQILFYRLPESQDVNAYGGGDLSSLSDQSSYQVGGGGGSFPGTTGVPAGTSSSSGSGSTILTTSSLSIYSLNTPEKLDFSPTNDTGVKNFINTTNSITPAPPAGTALVFGNQCLSSDTSTPVAEEMIPLEDPQTYISGIAAFIGGASVNDVIDNNLLAQFTALNPPPLGGNTSSPGYATGVANSYAEQAFGDAAPGTCEYGCNGLALAEQTQCELSCASSCIKKCNATSTTAQVSCTATYRAQQDQCQQISSSLKKTACLTAAAAKKATCLSQTVTDEALCVSDCTCFMIAGPNGKGREKVEDMFRIKFCKVPVQKTTVEKRTKVYSIYAIFNEISQVLQGLRDSGQMVKFSKKKEFLDGNIKISFANNFAFQLLVGFKPIFEQKSTTVKYAEREQANKDLNLSVLGMNSSAPEADDYNKYIVVSDPIKNKANLEQATDLSEINANIDKFQIAASAANTTKLSGDMIDAIATAYGQQTKVIFVQNIISFLKDNQTFRNNLSEALLDMNAMSLELKAKIETAK